MVDFQSTQDEAERLLTAIAAQCECRFDKDSGATLQRCASHKALVEDQRFVSGLICERRRREQLLKEEGQTE